MGTSGLRSARHRVEGKVPSGVTFHTSTSGWIPRERDR